MRKIILFIALIALSSGLAFGQSKEKPSLYLFFESDSNSLKVERKQTPTYSNGEYLPDRYDVYGFKTIDKERNIVIVNLPFATINKYRYRVTDSVEVKGKTIIPLKNVLRLRDVHYDILEKRHFPYSKIFIVEKLSANQFKIIQVHSYIGSDVVSSGPIH